MDVLRFRNLLPDIEDDELIHEFNVPPQAPEIDQDIPVRDVPALEDPPRDRAPALNHEVEEDVFDQIFVPEVLPHTLFQQQLEGLNAAARAKLREVSIRVQTYAFKDEYMPYLVDLFMGQPHDLLLNEEHHQFMLTRYELDNNAFDAAKKIECLAHLEAIHEIVESRVYDRVAEIQDMEGTTEAAYQLRIDPIDIYGCNTKFVVCVERHLLGTADFKWYTATVTRKNNSSMRLTIPHHDRQANFAIGDRIRIYRPPHFRAFEMNMELVEALRRDGNFRRKYFPEMKEQAFPPVPNLPAHPRLQGLNLIQQNVIRIALNPNAPPYPSVVIGPPGTRKTYLLALSVFMLYELWLKDRNNTRFKMLIVTPSNNAADVVTLKLLDLGIDADHIWRAVSPGVKMDRFDQRVLRCTRSNDRNVFSVLNDIEVKEFPIIVCTMGFAPYLKGVGKKHFTHLYADESGQALDMQSLATFAAFTWTKTRVMIFGGPQQLRTFFADSVIGHQNYNAALTTLIRLSVHPRYAGVGNRKEEWKLLTILERNHRSRNMLA